MRDIICRVEWIKRVLDVLSLSMITQAKPPSDVLTWVGFQKWIKNPPVSESLRFLFNVHSEDGTSWIVAVKSPPPSPAPPPLQSVWKKAEKMKLEKNTNTKSMAYPSKRATPRVLQPSILAFILGPLNLRYLGRLSELDGKIITINDIPPSEDASPSNHV